MIYIVGSIGSGKSTLTKLLSEDMRTNSYYEDVNNGLIKNMLEEFYSAGAKSRKQVSAMLQVAFLTFRYQQLKKAIKERNSVLDSSLLSDYILATNLYNRGEMDEASYNVYLTLNQEMQSNVNGNQFNGYPDLVVFLDISKEHELEEIEHRGRKIETVDPKLVGYYHSVNKAYKNWYKGFYQSKVIRIDRDKLDFVNNPEDKNTVLDVIEQELVNLGKLSREDFAVIKNDRNTSIAEDWKCPLRSSYIDLYVDNKLPLQEFHKLMLQLNDEVNTKIKEGKTIGL